MQPEIESSGASSSINPKLPGDLDQDLESAQNNQEVVPDDEEPQKSLAAMASDSTDSKAEAIPVSYAPKVTHHDIANAIVRGLVIADRNGYIKYWSPTYLSVQEVISALRQGQNWRYAAQRNHVSEAMVAQLLTWGGLPPANRLRSL